MIRKWAGMVALLVCAAWMTVRPAVADNEPPGHNSGLTWVNDTTTTQYAKSACDETSKSCASYDGKCVPQTVTFDGVVYHYFKIREVYKFGYCLDPNSSQLPTTSCCKQIKSVKCATAMLYTTQNSTCFGTGTEQHIYAKDACDLQPNTGPCDQSPPPGGP